MRRDSGLRRIVSTAGNLIDGTAVGTGPRTPLVSVDVVQVAVAIALDRRLAARSGQKLVAPEGFEPPRGTALLIIAVCVVVPDVDPLFDQIADIRISAQEPQQFVDHPLEKDPFGGQQRKALRQVEAHLMSEDSLRAGPGAVTPHHPFGLDTPQQVEILFHRVPFFAGSGSSSSSIRSDSTPRLSSTA